MATKAKKSPSAEKVEALLSEAKLRGFLSDELLYEAWIDQPMTYKRRWKAAVHSWRDACQKEGRTCLVAEVCANLDRLSHLRADLACAGLATIHPSDFATIARRVLTVKGAEGGGLCLHGGYFDAGIYDDEPGEFFCRRDTHNKTYITVNCPRAAIPEVALLLNDMLLDLVR